ncbi:VOC family protein [Patulibacter sp. SYSU D01012]|uniref:VOC family protein n=1 Tax=Patulibacter sp. SYSU D01012 TaxID=2817381 RepID=UPI001B311B3B|nr:VOC family protein [Patulibacter sp. SYSU D01012]
MDVNDVVELTIETDDLAGLERFYTRAFGLEVLSRDDDRIWLKLGERTRLGLWTPGKKEFDDEGGRHVHFAMSAAPRRLDAICARLRDELGVDVEGPVEHDGGDRSIYLRDPAGNLVEVWDFFERGKGAHEGADGLAA